LPQVVYQIFDQWEKQKKDEKSDAHTGFLARGRKSNEKKHGSRQEVS
jgi:hypothetical protein